MLKSECSTTREAHQDDDMHCLIHGWYIVRLKLRSPDWKPSTLATSAVTMAARERTSSCAELSMRTSAGAICAATSACRTALCSEMLHSTDRDTDCSQASSLLKRATSAGTPPVVTSNHENAKMIWAQLCLLFSVLRNKNVKVSGQTCFQDGPPMFGVRR